MSQGDSNTCDHAIKDTTRREKASVLSIEESAGILQHIGHASKKHSIRRERMENKVGGGNICGVQRVPVQRH